MPIVRARQELLAGHQFWGRGSGPTHSALDRGLTREGAGEDVPHHPPGPGAFGSVETTGDFCDMLWGRGFGADSIPFGAVKAVVKTAAGRRGTENCWAFSPYMPLLRAAVRARRARFHCAYSVPICDM